MNLRDAEAVVEAIWVSLPLSLDHAMFVSEKAPQFGSYTPRPDTDFKPGEPLLAYLEPVGYLWKDVGDGIVMFGVSLDFEISTQSGEVLGGQKGFLNYSTTSRAKIRELMLNASLNLNGFVAGDYVLNFTLRDLNSPKIAETALPFKITA